jgi:hypothetical protein
MSGVEVLFAGGPADGRLSAAPGTLMEGPPETYELMHASHQHGIRNLVYRLEVNPADDGPAWLYRYVDERPA